MPSLSTSGAAVGPGWAESCPLLSLCVPEVRLPSYRLSAFAPPLILPSWRWAVCLASFIGGFILHPLPGSFSPQPPEARRLPTPTLLLPL